ncbi:SET domain-containing protein [Gonapodya prolifera JEL478]|uniref:SET domain-containing protein n=1 Tax=Gonapodya prolifera (strain JEL478) TaxID=1344416 RepID=A0A139AXV5_GONPJ|nr:SET domain-containing protein [Gonapodya prolifera JEL478]|eukprot:KXS21403.1 SET domain-containing protein [Gonapodya prolifera JEL478]
MTDKTEETTIPTFLSWLRSHGTTRLENVAWKTEDGSNERPSCFAAQSIPPHSPIMSIPSSLVLTEFDAAMSPPGRAVMAFLESREHVNDPLPVPSRRRILILPFLVYERFVRPPGESRFWHYLDLLPPKYEDPLWWTEEERKRELSGTNVLAYAESREELLKKDWEVARRVCSDAFGKDGLTWHNFLWAHSALYSRCFPSLHSPLTTGDTPPFTIPFDTVPTFDLADLSRVSSCGMALLPGLDMLNHGVGVEVVWKTTQGDDGNDNSHNADIPRDVPCVSFFTSSQPVDEGVPLLNNYGPKGNEELLMGYGFVVESSPDDYVRVRMAVRGLADTSAGVTNEILRRRLRVLHLLDPPRDGDGTVVTAPQVPSSGVELLDSSSSRPTFLHHLRARDPVPRSLMVQASVFTATESELSLLERRGGGEGEWDPTREPVTKRNVLASLAQVRTLLNGKHAALWTVHDQARAWWEHANSERAHDRDWVGKLGRDLRAGE